MPLFLLFMFSVALSIGMGVVVLLLRRDHDTGAGATRTATRAMHPAVAPHPLILRRPTLWLAIRSRSLQAVQTALGLLNAKPCSLRKGLAGETDLFIAPPLRGWILVMGSSLPEPADDVDACYRFVTELSRRLGHVQLFAASHLLHHHAWVRAERGRVVRAYAWAGQTLWKQGKRTADEQALGMSCPGYFEALNQPFGLPDVLLANVEKVPLLASRWSLDPGAIEEGWLEQNAGVAGDLPRRF